MNEEAETKEKPSGLQKKIIELHRKLCAESRKKMGTFIIEDLEAQMQKVTDYIKVKAQTDLHIDECGKRLIGFMNRSKMTFSIKQLEMEVFRFFVGK